MENKKLYLNKENKKIAGVCSGLAEYFEIDPTIVRFIWVFITLFFGMGIILYIIAVMIIPRKQCEDSEEKVKKLYRLTDDRKIAGVCSGLGEYFKIDATIIRLIWIIATIFYGIGIIAYLIAIIVIPKNDISAD